MSTIPIQKIKPNGSNPRIISEEKFRKLVRSIKEFPEMLEARPIVVNPDYEILGGNMRYKACLEIGLEEVPVYVATWEETKNNRFVITDNVSFGVWDWDELANSNDWQNAELQEWGLDVWDGSELFEVDDEEQKTEVTDKEPSHTAEGYSLFECVLLIENKNRLYEGINLAKEKHGLDTTEEALIAIINNYIENAG